MKSDKRLRHTSFSGSPSLLRSWKKEMEQLRSPLKKAGGFAKEQGQRCWHFLRRPKVWILLICALLLGFYISLVWDLPDVTKLGVFRVDQTTSLYDRSGTVELYTIHDETNRKVIRLEDMNRSIILAVLAAEDDRFFEHGGYDLGGTAKGICYLIAEKSALDFLQTVCPPRGGSTLSQQLAKNLLLTPEKTLWRKLRELVLANRIEQIYPKPDILEMYLNTVPFGSDLYGVEAASQAFFAKSTKDLTLPEAIVLAGVIQRPSYFSPWNQNHFSHLNISADILEENNIHTFSDLEQFSPYAWQYGLIGQSVNLPGGERAWLPGRTDWVLRRMYDLGFISEDEYLHAKPLLPTIAFNSNDTPITAPHFVMYVREQLEEMFGPELVQKGGLKVYTSLDMTMQQKAEAALAKWAPNLKQKFNTNNGTIVAMDPHRGDILAMVGSENFWDKTIDGQVNVALRYRSAGSTFKPFVYAAAFTAGLLNPESVIVDMPTTFPGNWRPKNFDGRFHGAVTVRQAIGNSFNIPAIKALVMVGLDPAYALAQTMGITFLHEASFYGLTMAIGSADIRPLDLLTGYSVFDNEGKQVTPVSIVRVEDHSGNVIFERKEPVQPQILKPEVAAAITDILSDPKSRGIGWNTHLQLKDRPNAIKTGTSNRRVGSKIYPADLWAVGYTPELSAVVWVGNTNGDILDEKASGLLTSGDIWRDFMAAALEGTPRRDFAKWDPLSLGATAPVPENTWLDIGSSTETEIPE